MLIFAMSKGHCNFALLKLRYGRSECDNMSGILGTYMTRQGDQITLRLIGKDDAGLLVEMFHQLSPESKRLRFHLYTEKLPEERIWQEAIRLSDLDPQRHVAVAATIIGVDNQEHAVGVARFARAKIEDTEAEVAIVVRDDFQRKGLGRYLLEVLAERARQLGITHFTGWVAAENIRLMRLIKTLELNLELDTRHGVTKVRAAI